MAVTQYVGARYVPLFADPLDWDSTREYEPLTIVYNAGNSYTSRQYVPTGIDINNDDYWALTGNYNAQIEQYRQEVRAFDERITNAQSAADAAQTEAESKAPVPHASPDTTYGIGDSDNYGHVKLTDTPSESGASAGVAASPAMVNAVKETIDNEVTTKLEELQENVNSVSNSVDTKAPINHASTEATYGLGTETNYGHVKVTDQVDTSNAVKGGSIAVSPYIISEINGNLVGGNGTLIYNPTVLEGLTPSSYASKQYIARAKADNLLHINMRVTNETGSAIPTGTNIISFEPIDSRYTTTLTTQYEAMIISSDGTIRLNTIPRLTVSGTTGYINLGSQILANEIVELFGTFNIAQFQGGISNNRFHNSSICNQICDYFLNGGTHNWMGTLTYSNDNDNRLTPESSGETDCSGMYYSALNHFGFHPVGSVQPAFASNGIPIAYAKAGEVLDVSNALPGDCICFQNPEANDLGSYSSWTHCAMYAGNNTVYEMASTYPTGAGGVDGKGPFKINLPASTYRGGIDDDATPRNRLIVRFI